MSINNNQNLEKELSQHMSLINKEIITRGGRVVLAYSDLSDTGGNPPPINWYNEITTNTNAVINNGYIANNVSMITLTLPTTSAIGDVVGITGKGAGGWKLQANSGQVIHSAQGSTVSGGYIKSGTYLTTLSVLCITANTDWKIIYSDGTFLMEV